MLFLGYITCGQKPPEQECANGFFHCTVSKACVPNDQLCDLQDDCGDSSDEEAMECELTKQGRAHHMFFRIPKLRIYDFLSRNFIFCARQKLLLRSKNANIAI
jgi:hypothetical protein